MLIRFFEVVPVAADVAMQDWPGVVLGVAALAATTVIGRVTHRSGRKRRPRH